uniref:Histone deacetylase complex subunit SAP30L n=1 Tax=Lygus hesperus TaxID=30085 RepID=A0A0A9WKW0_LYGHE
MEESGSRRLSTRRTAQANYNQSSSRNRKRSAANFQGVKAIVKCGSSTKNILADFSRVSMLSLVRYVKYYDLNVPPNASKRELIPILLKHFSNHPHVSDIDVISNFLYANCKYVDAAGIEYPTLKE